MKPYSQLYSSSQPKSKHESRSHAVWLRSKERPQKENIPDHFLSNLSRTKTNQIGYELEAIDQSNQQLVAVYREALANNKALNKRLEEETLELKRLEQDLLAVKQPRFSRSPSANFKTGPPGSLTKNLSKAIWALNIELNKKLTELEELKASEGYKTFEKLQSELEAYKKETAELVKLKLQFEKSEKERREATKADLTRKIKEKQDKAAKLEKELERLDEAPPQNKQQGKSQEEEKELKEAIAIQKAKNAELKGKIRELEDKIREKETEEDGRKKPDPQKVKIEPKKKISVSLQSFFMYVEVYISSYGLSLEFFLSFLQEGSEAKWISVQPLFEEFFGIPISVQKSELFRSLIKDLSSMSPLTVLQSFLDFRKENEKQGDVDINGLEKPQGEIFIDWIYKNLVKGCPARRLTCAIRKSNFSEVEFKDLGNLASAKTKFGQQPNQVSKSKEEVRKSAKEIEEKKNQYHSSVSIKDEVGEKAKESEDDDIESNSKDQPENPSRKDLKSPAALPATEVQAARKDTETQSKEEIKQNIKQMLKHVGENDHSHEESEDFDDDF